MSTPGSTNVRPLAAQIRTSSQASPTIIAAALSSVQSSLDLIESRLSGLAEPYIPRTNPVQLKVHGTSLVRGSVSAEYIDTINANQIVGLIQANQINNVNANQIAGTIIASQIGSVNADVILGQITASQIASLTAGQITGQITAGQITSLTAGQITGVIVTSQLADSILSTAKLFADAFKPIQRVATLPTLPDANYPVNSLVLLSTDHKVYKNVTGTWTVVTASDTITGQLVSTDIVSVSAGTIIGLITAGQIQNIAATQITGQLTASQIASVNATAITGSITAGQIQSITAGQITGQIIGSQIANATIVAGNIANATITSTQIANATINLGNLIGGNFDNMLEDPGFEKYSASNITWVPGDSAFSVQTDAVNARSGYKVLRLIGNGVGHTCEPPRYHPVAPGQEYYVEIYSKTADGAGSVYFSLAWYDKDNVYISETSSVIAPTVSYTKSTVSSVAPAGAVYLRPYFVTTTGTGTWYFDDLYLRRKVSGGLIENLTITAANIANNTITAGQIANNTITAGQIANNTITAAQIQALTITAAELANATITGSKIAGTTITASNIAALTITASEIANLTITGGKIANATIDNAKISDLSADKINAGTLNADRLGANSIYASKLIVGNFSNLIENPSFEIAGATAAAAAGWTNNAGAYMERITPAGSHGNACLRKIAGGDVGGFYQRVNVAPGDKFYLEAYFNTQGATSGSAWLGIYYYNKDGTPIGWGTTATILCTDPNYQYQWRAKDAVDTAPANAVYGYVYLYATNLDGTVYFDQATVRRMTGTAVIEDASITTAKIGLLQVTAATIADATITGGKIANVTITAANIVDATITGAKIANATLTNALLVDATIEGAKIKDATIGNAKISDLSAAKINTGTLTVGGSGTNANISVKSALDVEIAWIGKSGTDYGIWGQTLRAGGSGFSTAKFRASSSALELDNAKITLTDATKTITIDPTNMLIKMEYTGTNSYLELRPTYIKTYDDVTPHTWIYISGNQIVMQNISGGSGKIQMDVGSGSASISVVNSAGTEIFNVGGGAYLYTINEPNFNYAPATSATAGTYSLPANPAGFLKVNIQGSAKRIPYYNI